MILHRKIGRSVLGDRSFYITGICLTAITVMLLIGAYAVSDSLYARFDEYFDEAQVEDGEFTTLRAIPEEGLVGLEEEYDVTAEQQKFIDTFIGDTRFRVFNKTDKLNLYTVTEGRELETDSDILVTYKYAKANGIEPGDTLTIGGREFTVCGLGMKPDYAIMLYDLTESIADKDGFGIGIITKDAMEQLGGFGVCYSVRYNDPDKEAAFRRVVYERYGTTEYIEKEANTRISLIYREADDLRSEFSVYCPVIMVVVIAVIVMVLARKVKREGKNIGTLMALGYRRSELMRHYLIYGMIPAVVGDALGLLLSIPFAKLFCEFYFGDAEYIKYSVHMPWKLIPAVLALPVILYGLVSGLVLFTLLKGDIIPLLKGLKKDRTVRIIRKERLSLKLVYNIRSVLGNLLRSATLLIGIVVATLVIVLGGSFENAYDNLIDEKVPYAMMGGRYEYGFREFQTENPYGGEAIFDISFGAKTDDSRFNLIGYDDDGYLSFTLQDGSEPEYGKYYMTTAAAKRYGIKPGDAFTFYHTATLEETTVRVDGLIQNDVLTLLVAGKEQVAQLIGHSASEYNVIISKEKLDIPGELLKKSASLEDYRTQARNLSATAGIVLKLLKVLGVCICLMIVTMMSGMIVEESSRNISMLTVLGYRTGEVRRFVLTANHLLVPLGFLIGVPLGYLTSYSMITASVKTSGMLMSLPVRADTILNSFLFVMLAYAGAMLLSGRKLLRVDMVESLRCPLE